MAAPTPSTGRPTPALQADSLYRFFRAGEEETLALQGVTLHVDPGEIVAVSGPSGSGKSTLLACLSGTDEPDGGTVRIDGVRLSHQPESVRARVRAERIGLLFQSANLLPHLTVEQNMRLVGRLSKRAASASRDNLLSELGISHRAGAFPDELSGGELARAGLAVALANNPVVLVADEPTGELDLETERTVLGLLRARARRGVAVVIASHSREVSAGADRVVTLADGRILG